METSLMDLVAQYIVIAIILVIAIVYFINKYKKRNDDCETPNCGGCVLNRDCGIKELKKSAVKK